MALLHVLAYAGGLAAFLFVTLSLASGLLWLAELIEEHSRHAKVVGMRAIYVIAALHVVLYFTDSLPLLPILFSIACHLVYLQNFSSSWPYISLTSPRFILSCILVVADHFIWFFHFAAVAQEQKKYRGPKYRHGSLARANNGDGGPAFGDVAAFFAICIWFVPLFLFLSLSANDNALPSFDPTSSAPPSPGGNTVNLSSPGVGVRQPAPKRRSLIKTALDPVLSILPRLRSSSRRKNEEGLIAPRTPIRGSPLHSPVQMPQSYFPWGSDDSANPTTSSTPTHNTLGHGSNLTPDRARTPPPPRRVQSEIQITKGATGNPRGIATRNGKPAFPLDENAEIVEAPRRQAPIRPTTPSMNLGPRGGLEQELTKRKAD
ncbi:hypothetical protein CI109_107211 [Kwoniella shandongensis]|uniref:Uncharacterized protein n=1 Tax=Kwoniella shandongensis TaxID=1734106 RepID=A0A5M6C2D3_9TREE|nr:uncharacterized protein CI109_002494 [Kwoniella shandongensis]KAA5529153.1 hypothetical protein CI109_002494 [Kwoniella shandongensis]